MFKEEDYDAFCLAYMFTYRDFEMGTLGLAWTGDLKNAGGVCEKNGVNFLSFKQLYVSLKIVKKSLEQTNFYIDFHDTDVDILLELFFCPFLIE